MREMACPTPRKAYIFIHTSLTCVIYMNITIRGLQETIFRRFKARAAEEDTTLGEALSQAMEAWLKKGRAQMPKGKLSDLKITDWGKGTEKSSEEIDKIAYGGELS